jgi:NADH-quinone oxidoreductase subunit M
MHTREIAAYGGLVNRMPWYATIFLIFTLANIGLPGTSGFIGEFLTLVGAYQANTWVAFLASFGVILSASYALWLFRKVVWGKLDKPALAGMLDIDWREKGMLAGLVALTIVYGVYPNPILNTSAASVEALLTKYQAAVGVVARTALAP